MDATRAYLDALRRRGLARATRTLRRSSLDLFVAFLVAQGRTRASEITSDAVEAYAVDLAHRVVRQGHRRGRRLAPATLQVRLVSVRVFCRWLVRQDVLLMDPSRDIALPRDRSPLPRVLSRSEVDRLLAAPSGPEPLVRRDRAVLELFYSSGLRVSELLNLDLSDVDLAEGIVTVRHGKGNRTRRVPVGGAAVAALTDYLEHARDQLEAPGPGAWSEAGAAVFLGRLGGRPTPAWAQICVGRWAKTARIPGRVTPHTLRHTAAVHLLVGGADIRDVQVFLGHATVQTTVHYTRLNLEAVKAAHRKSHPRSRWPVQP